MERGCGGGGTCAAELGLVGVAAPGNTHIERRGVRASGPAGGRAIVVGLFRKKNAFFRFSQALAPTPHPPPPATTGHRRRYTHSRHLTLKTHALPFLDYQKRRGAGVGCM
jgi:hypothetical protein